MALSADDWDDVCEIVEGYAKIKGGMTPAEKREWAWVKAQERANPHCCMVDFEIACNKYGWARPDRFFWQTIMPRPEC